MNEPSLVQKLKDNERVMHALLDCILEGKSINLEGKFVPVSVIKRLENALRDGTLTGYLIEK